MLWPDCALDNILKVKSECGPVRVVRRVDDQFEMTLPEPKKGTFPSDNQVYWVEEPFDHVLPQSTQIVFIYKFAFLLLNQFLSAKKLQTYLFQLQVLSFQRQSQQNCLIL